MVKKDICNNAVEWLMLLILSVIAHFQFQIASVYEIKNIFKASLFYNVLPIFLIILFIYEITKKNNKALYTSGATITCWNVVAYYVFYFHGSPLCFSEFKNTGTAIAVLKGYRLFVNKKLIFIIGMLIPFCFVVFLFSKLKKEHAKYRGWKYAISFLIPLLLLILFFADSIVSGRSSITWSRSSVVEDNGYIQMMIQDAFLCTKKGIKPDGYDAGKITFETGDWTNAEANINPDIILILNESFNDLRLFTDVKTDINPWEPFENIENARYGYAVTSWAGGGTNNSEFELLTLNGMSLMPGGAPFNYYKFDEQGSNVVTYLEKFGYETYAFHYANKANYSRSTAYPKMGFDNIFLGDEDFKYHNMYGNRWGTDKDGYQELIDAYEQGDGSPKFMYILTYQNHGDYNQNPAELDLVSVQTQKESLTDLLNEYLSSIYQSSQAFADLVEYYSNSERPVIICMVGDHTFAYIYELIGEYDSSDPEMNILMRTVPYVIWSNYDINYASESEYASMQDIMPMVMYSAGIPLSVYQKKILDLHDVLPARNCFGFYMDNDGNFYTSDTLPYEEKLTQYLYSEYNGVIRGSDYLEKLFE